MAAASDTIQVVLPTNHHSGTNHAAAWKQIGVYETIEAAVESAQEQKRLGREVAISLIDGLSVLVR